MSEKHTCTMDMQGIKVLDILEAKGVDEGSIGLQCECIEDEKSTGLILRDRKSKTHQWITGRCIGGIGGNERMDALDVFEVMKGKMDAMSCSARVQVRNTPVVHTLTFVVSI